MSSSSQVPLRKGTYHTFLSYHDKTGESFAHHLYSALTRAGLVVNINDHNLTIGDQGNSSLIESSRTSIIVFSANFYASKWFLKEMEKMLECSRTLGQVFVPVFYEVDPSEVRRQTGRFGEAFEDQTILTKDESDRYRTALTEAANVSGFYVRSSRNKYNDINDIVQHFSRLIQDNYFFVTKYPVGVEARMQDVIQLLNKEPPENTIVVGIWGITGVGKTTIAKATYNQMGSSFEGKSFLVDVNEVWESSTSPVSLQKQLLSDIYKTIDIHIDTVESGKRVLQQRLRYKRIFLVLDNVNSLDQLNALCGSLEWFGHGTRIIITTTDKHILRSLQVDHVYEMKYMDNTESLEFFSWHAFNIPSPMESYAELCSDVVEYCGGLPLALKVIGYTFFNRSVEEWKNALEKLKTIPHHIIMEKLMTNFDDLDGNEKEIFLDIATSLIGLDKDDVIQTLNYSGRFSEIGITILEEKCLCNCG